MGSHLGWERLGQHLVHVTDVRWKSSDYTRCPGLCQSLFTSADALLLSRQDPGSVDDAYAVQDRVGQLGAHEPAREQEPRREMSRLGYRCSRWDSSDFCTPSSPPLASFPEERNGKEVFYCLKFPGVGIPCGPVVRILHFHCRGHGFHPWSGN